jgi:hypothetical protein
MLFTTTFVTLVLAASAAAGPTTIVSPSFLAVFLGLKLVQLRRDDDLATFCFEDDNCFQAGALPQGCVDLPLFSVPFETASLSAPGLECILSP